MAYKAPSFSPVTVSPTQPDSVLMHTPCLMPSGMPIATATTRRPPPRTAGSRSSRTPRGVDFDWMAMVLPSGKAAAADYRKGRALREGPPFPPFSALPGQDRGGRTEVRPLPTLVLVEVDRDRVRVELTALLERVALRQTLEAAETVEEVRDALAGGVLGRERRDVHLRDVPALAGVDARVGPELRLVVRDERLGRRVRRVGDAGARARGDRPLAGGARRRQERVVLDPVAADQRHAGE